MTDVEWLRSSAMKLACSGSLLASLVAASPLQADVFFLPVDGDSVVGSLRQVTANADDTLVDIARRENIGFEEIRLANPNVDTWLPGAGAKIQIPGQFVLPQAPRRGIVLNLAELRLYYYPEPSADERPQVITHPVSIGRQDWTTPLGRTRIIAKVKDPAWHPPQSIRDEHAADGDPLPARVPPGPDNPLGRHALRLGLPGYLIHGTNKPNGIGMRVSHGCVRMSPQDIESLFDTVSTGTPVHIVNQPVKVGWTDGTLMIEVHPQAVSEDARPSTIGTEATRRVVAATDEAQSRSVNWDSVTAATANPTGLAYAVSKPGAPRSGAAMSANEDR